MSCFIMHIKGRTRNNLVYRVVLSAVIFLLFLFLPCGAKSAEPLPELSSCRNPLTLEGEWKIILDDNARYAEPGYNDTSWESYTFPGSIQKYSIDKGKGYTGVFWVRKKIVIDKEMSGKDLGLILGHIGNADQTYFNGIKVGETGGFPPDEYSMWNTPRHYFISHKLIRYGQVNVIAVRVSYMVYGEILGKLTISTHDLWKKDRLIHSFLRQDVTYLLIGMGITLLIIFTLFYFRMSESKEFFYYTIQFIFGFIVVFELCDLARIYPGTLVRFQILGPAWVGLNVAHPIFLHRLYDLERKWIERLLWADFFLIIVINIIFVNESNLRIMGLLLIVTTLTIGVYNISCHVSALKLKRPYASFFSFFGISVVLMAIHDGIVYLSKFSGYDIHIAGYHFNDMYFHYSASLFYAGLALVLVYRFIDVTEEIEEVNANLEHIVAERTEQLDDVLKKLEFRNKSLTELALKDSLTGLYNHAAIHDRLGEILSQAERLSFSVHVIMMDLDDFKGINDRYGHQLGDSILIKIAENLKSGLSDFFIDNNIQLRELSTAALRSYDLVGRYGGDEFIMGLTHCQKDEAVAIMKRIRNRLKSIRFQSYPDVKVRGSFGIAMLEKGSACKEIKDLIALADMALYKAKAQGGDDIIIYTYGEE